jgi:hypothetical protein
MVVITTDNEARIEDYPSGIAGTLATLQKAVGGYIEVIDLPKHNKVMVVNEEGKLNNLKTNLYATFLFMKEYSHIADMIVGDAVFLSANTNSLGDPIAFTEAEAVNFVLDFQMFIDDAKSLEIESRESRALEYELRYG